MKSGFLKRPYLWAGIYGLSMVLLFGWCILDAFVIPRTQQIVVKEEEETHSLQNYTSTDTSYEDDNIAISIQKIREYETSVYIADVVIKDSSYLKTAFANDTFGKNITATTSAIASANNAILAINGDYYGFRNSGFVLRNGVIYRSSVKENADYDDLAIYEDGSFALLNEKTADINTLQAKGVKQILSFGPALVSSGTVSVSESDEVEQSKTSNPRTAIGIVDNLHYKLVVSDGRTSADKGLSLYELAQIMMDQGCSIAYNLDGGGSSTMWFQGLVVNNPTDGKSSGERKLSDIVYVGY